MSAAERDRDGLMKLLDAALTAHEDGDEGGYRASIKALMDWRARPLQAVFSKLARELADVATPASEGGASGLGGFELGDARTRLDHVLRLTESAAHRTLDGVEDSRRILETLAAQSLPPECAAPIGALRGKLSEMAQAQEYQDLSGQIIRRVVGIVERVEAALAEIGRGVDSRSSADMGNGLAGPAVPGIASRAVSQGDADALLAELGL